ncbi:MAG: antirestriction protein ArdA [Enterococcus sp.]
MVRIFVENLGMRNSGFIKGMWFDLPESFRTIASKIGLNEQYEEYIITDYEAPFPIGEFDSIDKLNQMTEELDELPTYIEAYVKQLIEEYYASFEELLNDWENIIFVEGVTTDKLYGQYIIDEGYFKVPSELEFYIDYESLGRDWRINGNILYVDDGMFIIVG